MRVLRLYVDCMHLRYKYNGNESSMTCLLIKLGTHLIGNKEKLELVQRLVFKIPLYLESLTYCERHGRSNLTSLIVAHRQTCKRDSIEIFKIQKSLLI